MSGRVVEDKFPLTFNPSKGIKVQGEGEYYPSTVMRLVKLITYVMAMPPGTRMLVG